jgi:hypothetical protein
VVREARKRKAEEDAADDELAALLEAYATSIGR